MRGYHILFMLHPPTPTANATVLRKQDVMPTQLCLSFDMLAVKCWTGKIATWHTLSPRHRPKKHLRNRQPQIWSEYWGEDLLG